jgi:hypothetical protein
MEITCQLSQRSGNPQLPRLDGDAIKAYVEFPLQDNFFDVISKIHDQAFEIKVDKKTFSCAINQDANPVVLNFPDAESSPPVVTIKLLIYCDVEEILSIRKNKLKLII